MATNRKAEVDAAQKNLDLKNKRYQLELDTTKGKILLDLLSDVAPGHVQNLLGLAKIGYYDGLIFHRIIKGFMIQGGCPQGTGSGGPGYTIRAEFNDTRARAGRALDGPDQRSELRRLTVLHLPRKARAPGSAIHRIRPHRQSRKPGRRPSNRKSRNRRKRSPARTGNDQKSHGDRVAEVIRG